jgi:hypothetical protein
MSPIILIVGGGTGQCNLNVTNCMSVVKKCNIMTSGKSIKVLKKTFLVNFVPRGGRRIFYILILLQIVTLVLKYKSGPERGFDIRS